MTKPLHAGRAAESGVVAAELAALGWTAAEQILEAPRGFFRAAGGGYDPNAIVHKLDQPWTFRQPGISIKRYPSGSLTHPAMTEMARLIARLCPRLTRKWPTSSWTAPLSPVGLVRRRTAWSTRLANSKPYWTSAR